MSTQMNTYVLYGVVLPYTKDPRWDQSRADSIDDNSSYMAMEPFMDSAFQIDDVNAQRGITVLFDGRDGDYIAVGRVIAKTHNHCGFNEPVSVSADAALLDMVRANIAWSLPEFGWQGDIPECGWHVITKLR